MLRLKKRIGRMAFLVALLCITVFVFTACQKKTALEPSKVKSVDDLPNASIGVQLGTTGDIYSSDYEEQGSTVVRYTKAADAVEALKQGKIDCIIVDNSPAQAFVANNPDLSILNDKFADEQYAIALSKSNPQLKQKINGAIKQLKENGTLDNIIKNYIGDSTKGQFPYESPKGVNRTNGTLSVATNATFEPYEFMQNNKIVGIDMDMVQAICDILGMNLKVDNIEFDAIINSVQSGKSDIGIAGMTVTEERLNSIDFTDPYTSSVQVIIVRNGEKGSTLKLADKLYDNFIKEGRWKYIAEGLGTTIEISIFAVIIGLVAGFIIAILRSTCDRTGKAKFLNFILKAYLTIIRGTPTMIQLLIIYYVIFASADINKVMIAVIAFGLNSSAYVAEIVRSGINSIDIGQFEAGRSMGFGYVQTMRYFILPQAVKNVLPALGNEFIVLLKETSISGYIGIMDLTRGGDYIRSRTYEAFLPLIAVAVVYLIIVVVLSTMISRMERRLKSGER